MRNDAQLHHENSATTISDGTTTSSGYSRHVWDFLNSTQEALNWGIARYESLLLLTSLSVLTTFSLLFAWREALQR